MNNYNLFVNKILNKYPLLTIRHNKLLNINIINNNEIDNNNESNISINDIINNELENINDEIKDKVKSLLLNELKDAIINIEEKCNWKLLSLEFNNLLPFGQNNSFDFTKLTFDEITGLIGKNGSGKSSLIDIILFSLYGKYSRDYNIDSDHHYRYTHFYKNYQKFHKKYH